MASRFNTVGEITSWPAFEYSGALYDLSHLDAHEVWFEDQGRAQSYKFIVTYSSHCFTRDNPSLPADSLSLMRYPHSHEKRHFDFERYELSLNLRQVVEKLHESFVAHAGYSNYAIVRLDTTGAGPVEYFVVFTTFREKKRLRIHVLSAYPKHERGKYKKVSFFVIAYNLLRDRKLPTP